MLSFPTEEEAGLVGPIARGSMLRVFTGTAMEAQLSSFLHLSNLRVRRNLVTLSTNTWILRVTDQS